MSAGLRGCPEPLTAAYDAALVDLDGVVYRGSQAVPAAAEALAAAGSAGMAVVFVTNNAARTPAAVARHLSALGVPAAPEDIVTSAQAAARMLVERLDPGSPVLVLGADGLLEAVRERVLRPVSEAGAKPVAVVQGFDPEMTYARLAEAAVVLQLGALWVATNLDATVPSPRGLLPGNGSLVALLRTATGRTPVAAGKPERPLHDEALRRTGARRPLVVGDRLDTDIAGARAVGADSLLVLTGVATPDELLRAAPDRRPSYVGADLMALLEPHPQPEPAGRALRCGAWTAVVDGGQLRLTGGPDRPLDALRAGCAAVWAGWPDSAAPATVAWTGPAVTGR